MKEALAAGTMAVAVLVAGGACRVATVRPIGDKDAPASGTAASAPFDAVAFVDAAWHSEVLPSLEEARDVEAVLRAAANPAEAPGRGPAVLVVRGRGRVVEVDTRSRSGRAKVELAGMPPLAVVVQVGPVLTGTAIRDALPALGFDRFVNQIQHADVGNELNARVERDVLGALDRAALRGRYLRFAGMATIEEGGSLTITPVTLEAEGAP